MDSERQAFLRDAAARERQDLVQLSVRELLGKWGHKRRGYWIVARIERDLDQAGLVTNPPLTQGWIDSPVILVPQRLKTSGSEEDDGSVAVELDGGADRGEVTLLVGGLRAASQGVCSVPMDSSLLEAQSLMMSNDYSQLAVMSGRRDLRGAVTWESIAQASMRLTSPSIRDCMITAETVRFEDDLIHHIPRIVEAGYVFVRASDQRITGIVTTADLSDEFARLATPFFLIGEIERRLRRAVDRVFTSADLRKVRDPRDPTRDVISVDDLSMGEYVRLFENPASWSQTGWQMDRAVFVGDLDSVREIRNDVMHFSPDPLDDSQLDSLRRFIRLLKILDP